ncbi:uncharacterized protein LOC143286341 [Babylonia areolata]|uniref:uncharacterized protein LOC143286341 n=1 Tax=Babylonia areolata TaxID=304850 RepID=UPI003FD29B4C
MTCTADSDYIRAVSVKYKRCPSSHSVRSAVTRTGFELQPLHRPQTAQRTVPSCAQPRAHTARVQREKTILLQELMFFYGRSVHQSFNFARGKSPSPERSRSRTPIAPPEELHTGTTFLTEDQSQDSGPTRASVGSPWSCQNEALRQMFKASERRPRHRFFPRGQFLPKCTKT